MIGGMKRFRVALAAGLVMAMHVAACDWSAAVDDWAAADRLARSTLEELRSRGLPGIRGSLVPGTARYPGIDREVRQMRAALPPGAPDTVELVDSEVIVDGTESTIILQYVVRNANGAAQADVLVRKAGGDLKIETLRVSALREP